MSYYKFRDKTLSVDERVESLLEELDLEEKLDMLFTYQKPVERLGLKGFAIGAEVARGLVLREDITTVFPQPIGLAATFDTEIMHKMGEITGIESRIYSKKGKTSLCVWGPTVDAERDPRWGRTEEAYGEDPYLTGEMSKAYTLGMIGDDGEHMRVMPMLKHFYANNNEESRASDNASIPIALKHDYYLKFFREAMKNGGARGVMSAYNEINGVEGLCNPELSEILKKEWGMLFSVTDGGDFMQNHLSHKTDADYAETAARVYKNHGADIMTDSGLIVKEAVRTSIGRGELTENDIDSALRGVFKARFLLDEIDGDGPHDSYSEDLVCCEDYYKASERAACESVILLKNDHGVLPFDPAKTTAVIGTHGNMLFQDWYTGLSDRNDTIFKTLSGYLGENVAFDSGNDIVAIKDLKTGLYFSVMPDGALAPTCRTPDESSLFELIEWGEKQYSFKSLANSLYITDSGLLKATAKDVYGWYVHEQFEIEEHDGGKMLYNWQHRLVEARADGKLAVASTLRPENCLFSVEVISNGEERAKKLASQCNQTVLFAGNHPLINAREGYDRKHLNLPDKYEKLLTALLAVDPNTALFMVSSYPYSVCDPSLSAVMHICHAGPAIGEAVYKTLFGEISPAGRCPITWYRSAGELWDIKDYNIVRTGSTYLYYRGKPLYPFGHGLSYTEFAYSSMSASQKDGVITVTAKIANTGKVDSDEVVQLYVEAPRFSPATPIKQLKAFKRIHVKSGEKAAVELRLNISDLAFWDINDSRYAVYSGKYKLLLGASSADVRLTADIDIRGEEYPGIDVSKAVPGAAAYRYMDVEFGTDKALNEYALIKDWQSFIEYDHCRMKGYKKAEIVAFTTGSPADLRLNCAETGEQIALFRLPQSDGRNGFVTVTADALPIEGDFTLRFTTGGTVGLKSFRFFD